jgi:hypothetical protein
VRGPEIQLGAFCRTLGLAENTGRRSLERRSIEARYINDIRNINEKNRSWIRLDSVQVKNLSGLQAERLPLWPGAAIGYP